MDRKQLLLVDDDPSAIHALAGMLGGQGDLRFATSGGDALRLAHLQRPDLIVLDLNMPGLNGFEVCRALQSDAALAQVPVVVATSRADAAAEVAALELGVVDYLTKPLLPAQVLARVQAVLRRQPAATGLSVPTPAPALQVQRVLIVDDDPSAVLALRKALVPTGAQLYFADQGAGALAMAREVLPDLVVLDLHMPGLDGFDVCQRLLQDPALGEPCVLFVTRFSDVDNEARALALGATDFIGKPFSPVVLQARVRNLLRLRQVQQQRVLDERAQGHQRADSAERAHAAAESASAGKSLMLAYVAHEIGNPLNGMLGMAALMAMDPQQPLPPVHLQRLQLLQQAGGQLQRLLHDLLDLRQLETGHFTLDIGEADAVHIVQQALDTLSAQAQRAGVLLQRLPEPATLGLRCDRRRLQQCLLNLVGNALKFSPQGGQVLVELSQQQGELRIAVHDQGPGLSAQQQAALFEPFNRLGQSSATPGVGLGLLITRTLVQAMQGGLLVRSAPGQGSCFTLVLPGQAPDAAG